MTTIREHVDWDGLEFSVIQVNPISYQTMFYLTGEYSNFNISIKNLSTKERRSGKVVVLWILFSGQRYMTVSEIDIDLRPEESGTYSLKVDWLCSKGLAMYQVITHLGSPEDITFPITSDMFSKGFLSETLASYVVKDEGEFQYERKMGRTRQ